MITLGIETATEYLSAALDVNGTVYERTNPARSSHCEQLVVYIGNLVKEAGLAVDDIDLIAASRGPGSFTGLRIGIATATGLAFGTGRPVTGVGTLDALAARIPGAPGYVCPIIDARRGEVYAAVFRTSGAVPEPVLEARAITVADLAARFDTLDAPVTVTGPAAARFREDLESRTGADVSFASPETAHPSAVTVARLGGILHDPSAPAAAITPLYLRRSDAEIARSCKSES